MQEQIVTNLFQQVAALSEQLAQQQTRLAELENRPFNTTATPTTSRRRMLRHLATGLVSGLAVGGVALASNFPSAQARSIINPAYTSNRIGTIIVPPGQPLPYGQPVYSPYFYYGLIATDGSSLNLNTIPAGNGAVSGLANGGSGVNGVAFGLGSSGVFGIATGPSTIGVNGYATGPSSIGVQGDASGSGSYAGSFSGDVYVGGTLSKNGGAFKIDHPLNPANQYLYHSFVESDDMLNIYNGLITLDDQGTATVALPHWFETLNRDFRYGLTPIAEYSPLYIAQEVKGGQFTIAGGKAGQRVSWQLTGIRQDEWAKAHRIPLEETKPDYERGLYLHPELYGQPPEKGINRSRLDKGV